MQPAVAPEESAFCLKPWPDVLMRKHSRCFSRGKRGVDAESEHVAKRSTSSTHTPGLHRSSVANAMLLPTSSSLAGSSRVVSMPPAGAESVENQKARAVADLQKLFFEEVAKGQGANEAAAAALRRLRDQSLGAGKCELLWPSDPLREKRVADVELQQPQSCLAGSNHLLSTCDDIEADMESMPETAGAALSQGIYD